MTADLSLEQFVHLKQPACDYLSQAYEISSQLNDLIEALKQLLSLIQGYTQSSHNMLDNCIIPVAELEDLHLCQIQGIKYLRQAAEGIEELSAFEVYSIALAKQKVTHG
ncbi:MAG TPA: hypothetical protein VGH95_04415 [Candidatus Aquirickettsiella sp.]